MTDDFFRSRLDGMIDPRHPLAILGDKLPWSKLEASIAPPGSTSRELSA